MASQDDLIASLFGPPPEESKGITGHVMDFLSYLNAPNRALYGGLMDPEGFWEGAKKGWQDKTDYSLADLLGLSKPGADDDWTNYILKGIPYLGAAALGDPLNLLFAPAKAGGIVGRGIKALGVPEGKSIAGLVGSGANRGLGEALGFGVSATDKLNEVTGLGKAFKHASTPEYDEITRAAAREMGEVMQWTDEQIKSAAKKIKELGIPEDEMYKIFSGVESKGTSLPGALKPKIPFSESAELGPQTKEAYAVSLADPLVQKYNETFGTRNLLRELAGKEPIANITDELNQQLPHIRTDIRLDAGPEKRTLMRWVQKGTDIDAIPGFISKEDAQLLNQRNIFKDKEGNWIYYPNPNKIEPPIEVSVLPDKPPAQLKKLGFYEENGKWYYQDPKSRPFEVTPSPQTTLKDIYESGAMPKGSFIDDPLSALGIGIKRNQQEITFLKLMKEAEEKGQIIKMPSVPKGYPLLEDSMQLTGQPASEPFKIPKGFRQLLIPGMEDTWALSKVADKMENQAYAMFDKSTPIGAVGDVLQRFNNTVLGQKLGQFTDLFKATTLPLHPGWLAGNLGSGLFQEYASGGLNPLQILLRQPEAIAVAAGKGKNVIPQLKEAGLDILHEAQIRGLAGTGLFGSTGQEIAEHGPGLFGKIGELPPFKQIGKAQSVGYQVGGTVENTQKLAVFINELKQLPENFATMPKEARARILDKAAAKAQEALIDYGPTGGWTGFEKQLMNFIPFYKWQRGLAGQTFDSLTQSPQKLAATGRALDTFLQPMSPEDKNLMDPWAKEQSPITGIGPWKFGTDERGMPQMGLAGRLLPWGNIEQFSKRPFDFLESIINPAIKAPVEIGTNYSAFKNRPIDELSGGFPYSLTAPFTGGPYQKASEQQFGYTLPAAYDYLLTQAPGGRYLREVNELLRAAGVTEDKYKEASPDMGTFTSWWLTGGKQYPFDRSKAMMNRQKEQDKQSAALRHDLNFATMKGDMPRVEQVMQMIMEQETRKTKALGFLEN